MTFREFLEFHGRGVQGGTFAGVDGGAVLVKCADRLVTVPVMRVVMRSDVSE